MLVLVCDVCFEMCVCCYVIVCVGLVIEFGLMCTDDCICIYALLGHITMHM